MKSQRFIAAVALVVIATFGMAPMANAATRPTTAQKLQLQYIVEEEKLARDVYLYLAENVTSSKFANIARSEQTHMNYIATLLTKYKQTNPTVGKAAGVFVNKEIQALYNALTVEGSAGLLEAYGVGVKVEEVDIASLKELLAKPMPVDVKAALDLLLAASYNHLEAFSY